VPPSRSEGGGKEKFISLPRTEPRHSDLGPVISLTANQSHNIHSKLYAPVRMHISLQVKEMTTISKHNPARGMAKTMHFLLIYTVLLCCVTEKPDINQCILISSSNLLPLSEEA
jgi:hypothetical protein